MLALGILTGVSAALQGAYVAAVMVPLILVAVVALSWKAARDASDGGEKRG
jgi:hypothetical protein